MKRIGFSTIACPEATVDDVISLAVRNGFEGVELRHLHGTVELATLEELSAPQLPVTRRKFEDAGIAVVGVDSSVRFTSLDDEARRQQFEALEANIRIAEGLSAPYIRVFGGPLPKDQDREQTLEAIVAGLSQAARIGFDRGVEILIEAHDDFSTSASLVDLWDRGADEHLGILWDTLHTHLRGETAAETWAAIGPRVRHVHVKDALSSPGGEQLVLTGEGDVPLRTLLDLLTDVGYGGWINFEWERAWHPELVDAETAFPQFMGYMAAWADSR